jgi:hypothetical protein
LVRARIEARRAPGSGLSAFASAARRGLPAILSALVLAGAAWMWRDRIDLQVIGGRLASVDPLVASLTFVLLLAFSPLNAYRLKSVAAWVAGTRVSYAALLRVTCIGYFVAATLPIGLVGDAAKVGLMRPLADLTWRSSFQSVFGDRASGAVFVACLGALLLPARIMLGVPAGALVVEAAVFLLVLGGSAALLILRPSLPVSGSRFWQAADWIVSAMASLFQDTRRIAAQLAFASANILLTLCVIFLLARGMGIPVGALQVLQFVPVIILVTGLPFLYLGWGGREMIMVSTLGSLPGVSANDALSLAISIGGLGILAAFPNGLFLLTGWRGKPQT